LFFAITCVSSAASAAPIQIGLFSFDADTLTGNSFSITNLTGLGLAPEFPLETLLTFNVTKLTAITTGGGLLSLDGSAFAADEFGNVNCILMGDAETGGCNFAAHKLLSATVTGTLSATKELLGLPPGVVGIEDTFTATITPGCDIVLVAGCDAAIIEANAIREVPEPSSALLIELGVGLLACVRLSRHLPRQRRMRSRRRSSLSQR
jgi:hypothetical protein